MMVDSRLCASDLLNFSKLSASILEAPRAENWFRNLKGQENSASGEFPKISYTGKVGKRKKTEISRFLAKKQHFASKVNYFRRASNGGVFDCSALHEKEDISDSFKDSSKKLNMIIDKPQMYILFEHAAGLAMFQTVGFEEARTFLPRISESIMDISKFRSTVCLVAFQPFPKQADALKNMKSIVADELSEDLQLFLENNIPRIKELKQAVTLGVEGAGLASVISNKLNINCLTSNVVKEICRGIRFHFYELVKGFIAEDSAKNAQLTLAHNYSKVKVNYDSKRHDLKIIQSLNLADELEKDIKTFASRIQELYSCHFPELSKVIGGNVELYIKCVDAIGDLQILPEDIEEKLNILIGDTSKVQAILQSGQNSIGTDIALNDLENIRMLCQKILSLINDRQCAEDYLKAKMKMTAPNLSALVGEMVGSRLISYAGGLSNLAKLSPFKIQILAAKRNVIRNLNEKENPPWDELSKTSFMGKTVKKKRLMPLSLAKQCSTASKADNFRRTSTDGVFACSVLLEVEDLVDTYKNSSNNVNEIVDEDNSRLNFNVICNNELKSEKLRMGNLLINATLSDISNGRRVYEGNANGNIFISELGLNSEGKQSIVCGTNSENDSLQECSSTNNAKSAFKFSRKRKFENEKNFVMSGMNKENSEVSHSELVTPLKKRERLNKINFP